MEGSGPALSVGKARPAGLLSSGEAASPTRESTGPLPDVAVVIGAFSRRQFVREAIRSALAQSREGLTLEVVVIVNFRDPELEQEFADLGVRFRFDPRSGLERWIEAARSTRAPLIAFLDDDDLFDARRLSRAREAFRSHPGLGFYRNRVYLLTPGGEIDTDWTRWGRLYRDSSLDRTGPQILTPAEVRERLPQLLEVHGSFNSSTMVLRREILDHPGFDALRGGRQFDLALFVRAVLSGRSLYLDSDRLTGYRRHPENTTRDPGWIRTVAAAGTARRLAAQARRAGFDDLARWLAREQRRLERSPGIDAVRTSLRGRLPRWKLGALLVNYLAFLLRHPELLRPDADTGYPVYRILQAALRPMPRPATAPARSVSARPRRIRVGRPAGLGGGVGSGGSPRSLQRP
ncbi:MAG: glycosyltransferase [Thermoplasmata archaeon]